MIRDALALAFMAAGIYAALAMAFAADQAMGVV